MANCQFSLQSPAFPILATMLRCVIWSCFSSMESETQVVRQLCGFVCLSFSDVFLS